MNYPLKSLLITHYNNYKIARYKLRRKLKHEYILFYSLIKNIRQYFYFFLMIVWYIFFTTNIKSQTYVVLFLFICYLFIYCCFGSKLRIKFSIQHVKQ